MLNYQSTSFHDALYLRDLLNLRPAPEFEAWLERFGITATGGRLLGLPPPALAAALKDLTGETP